MKELDFIKIINSLTKSPYIGDDCAYLQEFGLVVTQDNFVEDVHFKTDWATPFQIGYKAAVVNISDVLASGAEPKYLLVGLSITSNTDDKFIEEFYKGIIKGANGAQVIGGDITGADKIFVSITAIGSTADRHISSRKNAKVGYKIITRGKYGLSSKGLQELRAGLKNSNAIRAHLEPRLDVLFSREIATQINTDYAMMDASDGLADALYRIAEASEVKIVARNIDGMFCAEDYNLVAAVPEDFLTKMTSYTLVGEVLEYDGCHLEIEGKRYLNYDELGTYNHFGDK